MVSNSMPEINDSNALDAVNVSNTYTAANIQVLGGREAIRKRPGMYIGSTDQRGLHHLVYEIIYNSVDEAMAGCCTQILVTIREDNSIKVEDNGRGIPVDIHPITGQPARETVRPTLHAGGKFGGGAYQVSGGLHGVGASAVNALSEWVRVEVKRNGKLHCMEFERGIPSGSMQIIGEADGTGTTVSFLADKEIFGDAKHDFNILANRVREVAYLNKELEISIRDERSGEEKTFYFEGGISGYVHHLNRGRDVRHPKPVYIYKQVDKPRLKLLFNITTAIQSPFTALQTALIPLMAVPI
jgi:DNA gyrase subunit B